MNMDFEDNYLNILQNMEFTTLDVYRQHPDMTDFQVDKAFEGLLRVYQAEQRGKSAPSLKLGPLDQQIYDNVKSVCEFHLGRPSTFENNVPERVLADIEALMKQMEEAEEELALLEDEYDDDEIDAEELALLEDEYDDDEIDAEELALLEGDNNQIKPIETVRVDLTVDEIIACLKRIRSSISLWTKQNGRQGYLNYVNQFKL